LVAVLIALYSGRTAREIAETDAIAIFDELGLREHLSTQRSNGLVAMVKRIRAEAAELAAA
jgi:cysteine desulfuration protein SufE